MEGLKFQARAAKLLIPRSRVAPSTRVTCAQTFAYTPFQPSESINAAIDGGFSTVGGWQSHFEPSKIIIRHSSPIRTPKSQIPRYEKTAFATLLLEPFTTARSTLARPPKKRAFCSLILTPFITPFFLSLRWRREHGRGRVYLLDLDAVDRRRRMHGAPGEQPTPEQQQAPHAHRRTAALHGVVAEVWMMLLSHATGGASTGMT